MVLSRGAAGQFVLDFLDAFDDPGGRLADEGASPRGLLNEVACDVPKLGREVLVDVEDVHGDRALSIEH